MTINLKNITSPVDLDGFMNSVISSFPKQTL